MAAAEQNNILYVTTDCMTFYCVTLYSQLPQRSGSSETPDDHVDACYKLGEYFLALDYGRSFMAYGYCYGFTDIITV